MRRHSAHLGEMNRHSLQLGDVNGSTLMEYSEYQRYRQQQFQSQTTVANAVTETTNATSKHHNPAMASIYHDKDINAPMELRQRVYIHFFFFYVRESMFFLFLFCIGFNKFSMLSAKYERKLGKSMPWKQ